MAPGVGPCDSSDTLHVGFPQELISRSDVLRNAMCMADGGSPSKLLLPTGASNTFFDSWRALVVSDDRTAFKRENSVANALEGLQVGFLLVVASFALPTKLTAA